MSRLFIELLQLHQIKRQALLNVEIVLFAHVLYREHKFVVLASHYLVSDELLLDRDLIGASPVESEETRQKSDGVLEISAVLRSHRFTTKPLRSRICDHSRY